MEFCADFKDNLSFHQSIFSGKSFKPQMENGVLIGSSSSKGMYQNFPDFDNFSIFESSFPHFSVGVSTPFYDPFDPFRASPASECANHLHLSESNLFGSNDAHDHLNVGFLSYPRRILLQDFDQDHQSYSPLNYHESESMNSNLSDEASCLTVEDMYQTKTGSRKKKKKVQPKGRKEAHQNPNIVKGQWTPEEDRLLVEFVNHYGEKRWSQIAQMLNGRVGKQCRERWHNHLRPDIKKDIWSEKEEMMLIEAHKQIGNKWAAIARKMPGRTENAIKNHWNATKRRRFSKTTAGRFTSLLQEYIHSLIASDSAATRDRPETPSSDPDPQLLLQAAETSDMERGDHRKLPTTTGASVDAVGFTSDEGMPPAELDKEMDDDNEFDDVRKETELFKMLYQGVF